MKKRIVSATLLVLILLLQMPANVLGLTESKGWQKEGDSWYYVGDDGEAATGWLKLGESWYYFDSKGAMQQGWQKLNNRWYYLGWPSNPDSGAMRRGWIKDGDKWYYLGWADDPDSGAMRRGWIKDGDRWYYLGSDGAMMRGWIYSGSKWYYLGWPNNPDSGAMRTGWIYYKDLWYYLQPEGEMAVGWVTLEEEVQVSVPEATDEADATEEEVAAPEEEAAAPVSEVKIVTNSYYMDENGAMLHDVEFEVDGEFYGAAKNGTVFHYTNSELIEDKIQASYYESRLGTPVRKITIHHMAAVMTAENCGHYFARKDAEESSNYGIGKDGEIYLYVDEKDRSHCSVEDENDMQAITIEVSNSSTGGEWPVSDASMESLINLCVDICLRNDIEALNYTGDATGNLTMHKWFWATNCPGPYLEKRFPEIAEKVNERLEAERAAANAGPEEIKE